MGVTNRRLGGGEDQWMHSPNGSAVACRKRPHPRERKVSDKRQRPVRWMHERPTSGGCRTRQAPFTLNSQPHTSLSDFDLCRSIESFHRWWCEFDLSRGLGIRHGPLQLLHTVEPGVRVLGRRRPLAGVVPRTPCNDARPPVLK
jgi:hypothetical protein